MRSFIWILILLVNSVVGSYSQDLTYPGHKRASCFSQPEPVSIPPLLFKKVQQKIHAGPFSTQGIWDQFALQNQPEVLKALNEFVQGTRGQQAKKIHLSGKTLEALHKELVTKGFVHQRIPLVVSFKESPPKYWKRDGSTTVDSTDPDLVPLDIYIYPTDGSIIRVNREAIPDPSKKTLRRQPHASKSVTLNLELICKKGICLPDTSFANEGFKVTEDGYAVPKAPNKESGLNQKFPLSTEFSESAWIDAIMGQAHIDLPTDFSHCNTTPSSQEISYGSSPLDSTTCCR